jgi:dinuclear metal center YbgI/SA1388 family protein
MQINDCIHFLETIAPPAYQEGYDNCGLLTGQGDWNCTGMLCTLDATEAVIQEAIAAGCNLVVAHHPIIFGGLKKINGKNYVERAIITAIKNDIAIYAIHTNLDNVIGGVSGKMAALLGLQDCTVLAQKEGTLRKLFTFVPIAQAEKVRNAIFAAGGGYIGQYSECSFNTDGTGTFKGNAGTNPFVGQPGEQHREAEQKIEVIFPAVLEKPILKALFEAHPYEEVAYDIVSLNNIHPGIGAGIIGQLPEPMPEKDFLERLKQVFLLPALRHTPFTGKLIQRVALCGGAGSSFILKALAAGADAYVTADLKYHEFFDADGKLLLADIGHFESEQFTIDLLFDLLNQKFPTFACRKSVTKTNPVHYYVG